jgi:hypothetical protein
MVEDWGVVTRAALELLTAFPSNTVVATKTLWSTGVV